MVLHARHSDAVAYLPALWCPSWGTVTAWCSLWWCFVPVKACDSGLMGTREAVPTGRDVR